MEGCTSEIQITFSPMELEVVYRAVERFTHVEISGTRTPSQLDHAKKVIGMLNRKLFVSSTPERRSSKITKKAPGQRLDACFVVSRRELEEIM